MRLTNQPEEWQLVHASDEAEAANVIGLSGNWEHQLIADLQNAIDGLAERGGLRIAWPKKKSRAPTDLTENRLRAITPPLELVDNKVCAIDEKWSGLRFVRRLNQNL